MLPHDALVPPWRQSLRSSSCSFRPGGPPTSAALSPRVTAAAAHSFRRRHPDFSRAHFVVGRFCVRVRPFQRHWGCRCPVAVSVSVDIHGIFGCPKQKSVVCPLEPGIVHGCLRQRAGPRLVCRSRMRTRRACASCDATGRSSWSLSRVCVPPPVQVCLVSCPTSPQIELAVLWLLANGSLRTPVGQPYGSEGGAGCCHRQVVLHSNGNRRQGGVLSGNMPIRAPAASRLVSSCGTFVNILDPCGHKMSTWVLFDLTKVIATPNIPLEVLGMAWGGPGGKSVRWCAVGGP